MPWQCIEEYEDTGTGYDLKRTYVYGNNIDEVLELEIVGVAKYYYHTNVQGNTVALTDEDDDIVEKFTYDVYGRLTAAWAWDGVTMVEVVDGDTDGDGDVDGNDDPAYLNDFIDAVELFAVSLIDNTLLFQGRRYDEESGLYYFRNRQYDPIHGRFLSRDPESYTDSMCLYSFVNNNPVCYVDPMGTTCWLWPLNGVVANNSSCKLTIDGDYVRMRIWTLLGGAYYVYPITDAGFMAIYAMSTALVHVSHTTLPATHLLNPGRNTMADREDCLTYMVDADFIVAISDCGRTKVNGKAFSSIKVGPRVVIVKDDPCTLDNLLVTDKDGNAVD